MQLKDLKTFSLKKKVPVKQTNGTIKDTFTLIKDYKVQTQELNDEVSASIYGADINKVLRLTSPLKDLESYLQTKLNNSSDNVSLYFMFNGSVQYKIVSVKSNWIDISL